MSPSDAKLIALRLSSDIAERLLTVYGPDGPAVAIAPILKDGSRAGEYARFEILDAITPIIEKALRGTES